MKKFLIEKTIGWFFGFVLSLLQIVIALIIPVAALSFLGMAITDLAFPNLGSEIAFKISLGSVIGSVTVLAGIVWWKDYKKEKYYQGYREKSLKECPIKEVKIR